MNNSWGKWGQLGQWARLTTLRGLMGLMGLIGLIGTGFSACSPEPPLHLYDVQELVVEVSVVKLDLQSYWETVMKLNTDIDIETQWYYGWDGIDISGWGEIGIDGKVNYIKPYIFEVRRYYTGEVKNGKHTAVQPDTIQGYDFQRPFEFGYWDMLLWNEIRTKDNVLSINIDENSLDSVVAYTNPTPYPSRYNAPRFTHSFHTPEMLFSAYEAGIEIDKDLKDFDYDAERDVWVRTLPLKLRPLTYIYLVQVILYNNNGRLSIDGNANLSGMARSVCLNSGRAGDDAITVYFNVDMKHDCDKDGKKVDIIGGQVMTFGIPGLKANEITDASQVRDSYEHKLDFNVLFNNSGMDSTIVRDVSDQIRNQCRGGIITIEIDVDQMNIPTRTGGSGFDAVVKDTEDGGTYEFDM